MAAAILKFWRTPKYLWTKFSGRESSFWCFQMNFTHLKCFQMNFVPSWNKRTTLSSLKKKNFFAHSDTVNNNESPWSTQSSVICSSFLNIVYYFRKSWCSSTSADRPFCAQMLLLSWQHQNLPRFQVSKIGRRIKREGDFACSERHGGEVEEETEKQIGVRLSPFAGQGLYTFKIQSHQN